MNCPKCNSPINEGDKFCQVCGNVLNNEPQQPVVGPAPTAQPAPVVNEQPAVNNMNQPMNNVMPNQVMSQPPMQPPTMSQPQPMNNGMPMNNQMPQPTKKNNTIVMILVAVIIILIAFVVYLVISNEDTKEPETDISGTKIDEPAKEEVQTAKYTETTVNGYKFKLPENYYAELYEGEVIFYNDDMDFEATITSINESFDNIDKEGFKVYLTSYGMTNVSYSETTINNKKVIIFKADYMGYTIEYVYARYSFAKIIGACVYYEANYEKVKDSIYDIITNVEITESSYSSNATIKLPDVALGSAFTTKVELTD